MGESHEEISKHVKVYIMVFMALLAGTLLTVGMYYVHFERTWVAVTIALVIATTKAFLVAGYFMHLVSEKTMIYAVLATTVFFFAALMGLTLFTYADIPLVTH